MCSQKTILQTKQKGLGYAPLLKDSPKYSNLKHVMTKYVIQTNNHDMNGTWVLTTEHCSICFKTGDVHGEITHGAL